jgi:transposase
MEWDQILRFSTFNVKHVSMPKEDKGTMRIQLIKKPGKESLCYRCAEPLANSHSFRRCQVDDLPILEHKVILNFRRGKGHCKNCGKIRMEAIEFLSHSNPKMTARLAFLLYKFCEIAPVSRMAEILDRNKMSLWRNDLLLLQTQFKHYKIPILHRISVDEVYAKAHHDEHENHYDRFFTIITDMNTRKVVGVEPSRRKAALDSFFKKIGEERCSMIEAVATDEHDDYIRSVEEHCPNAIHILDRFHLMRHFEEAINDTRKLLVKMLPQAAVKKLAHGKFRYIFLKRNEKRSVLEKSHMDKVMKDNEAFTRLELIKERMITFFDADDESAALDIFNEIETWAKESGFPPIKKFCLKLRRKWQYISNYFMCKISTGVSEGINNTIKALKRRSFGFRNMNYFMLKIMQVCGLLSSRYLDLSGNWTSAGLELIGPQTK